MKKFVSISVVNEKHFIIGALLRMSSVSHISRKTFFYSSWIRFIDKYFWRRIKLIIIFMECDDKWVHPCLHSTHWTHRLPHSSINRLHSEVMRKKKLLSRMGQTLSLSLKTDHWTSNQWFVALLLALHSWSDYTFRWSHFTPEWPSSWPSLRASDWPWAGWPLWCRILTC